MTGRKIGVILGYLAMFIQNVSAFILTPLLISAFGDGNFGVYKLVLTIASYFALADLGLSNSIVRYVSEYIAKNDKVSETKFVSLIILIDVFVGALLLLIGVFVYSKLPLMFSQSFTISEIDLLESLFFLTLINGVINLFTNLTAGIIKSYKNFAFLKLINIVKIFIRFGFALFLISLGFGPFAIILMDAFLSLFILIITSIYCFKHLKIRVSFKLIERKFAQAVLSYSSIVFIDALAFHLFWNADNFIIGTILSSSAIAVYSIGTLISTLFFSFSIIVSDVIMPGIVEQVTNGATDYELTDSMIKIGRIKLAFLALPLIGFIFLGKDFITLWLGESYIQAYTTSLLVIIPSMIAATYDAGLFIMWAKNKHKIKSIVSLAISVLNIILTVVLVGRIGIIGAAIGTSFAYIAGYVIFNTIYFHKFLHLDMFRFTKQVLSKLWIPMLIATLFSSILSQQGELSLMLFLIKVSLIIIVYLGSLWIFGLNEKERMMVMSILRINT